MPELEIEAFALLRLAVAGACGGLLGWERERKDRPAGFRTHVAVAMASALIMISADLMVGRYPEETTNIDPTRALEAVVAGVSFLGAGTILVGRNGSKVRGLTTAASLLVTAAIGLAIGLSAYVLAAGTTLAMLAVLRFPDVGQRSAANEDADDDRASRSDETQSSAGTEETTASQVLRPGG